MRPAIEQGGELLQFFKDAQRDVVHSSVKGSWGAYYQADPGRRQDMRYQAVKETLRTWNYKRGWETEMIIITLELFFIQNGRAGDG